MGVDTRIHLPADCQVRRVAEAIGILLGRPREWDGSGAPRWVAVSGVQLLPARDTCVYIKIEGTALTGHRDKGVLYHFEFGPDGGRGLLPPSSPLWIAVARRLVDFFGGTVDYRDCDEAEVDYARPHPPGTNAPEDGEEWDAFQQRLWELAPLTPEEVAACEPFAAY